MPLRGFCLGLLLLALPLALKAQTDEIQVYDASIAPVGKFNLTLHNNYIADGLQTPAFPGAVVPDHSWNGTAEWAYGAKAWLELGLYLPLYSVSQHRGATINGAKLRFLFVSPHAAQRKFFYGMNFEFSYNASWWDRRRATSEIRPIVGVHLGRVDLIYNPILDNSYTGGPLGLDFAPCGRIAYHFSSRWALAAEEYDDFGTLRHPLAAGQQFHQLWSVVDFSSKLVDIETGIGFGLNAATDPVTLKLMFSRDLN